MQKMKLGQWFYGMIVKRPTATGDGSQISFPATEPLRMHSPGARNLTQRSATVQTVGVVEMTVYGVVKPKVTDLLEALK